MRIAVIILGALLLLAGVALFAMSAGAGGAGGVIKMAIGGVLAIAGAGVGFLGIRHPAMVAAGEERGEAVMPVGRMAASLGALGVVWLYNVAVLAVLIVLTIRLI